MRVLAIKQHGIVNRIAGLEIMSEEEKREFIKGKLEMIEIFDNLEVTCNEEYSLDSELKPSLLLYQFKKRKVIVKGNIYLSKTKENKNAEKKQISLSDEEMLYINYCIRNEGMLEIGRDYLTEAHIMTQ